MHFCNFLFIATSGELKEKWWRHGQVKIEIYNMITANWRQFIQNITMRKCPKNWKSSIIQTAINYKSMDAAQRWTFFAVSALLTQAPLGGSGSQGGPYAARATSTSIFHVHPAAGTPVQI